MKPDERLTFDGSMLKEWGSWQKFDAVEKLAQNRSLSCQRTPRSLAHDGCIRTRMKSPGDLQDISGKTTGQVAKDYPFEPKSQGCQDVNDGSIRSGCRVWLTTASLLAFNLV